MILASEDIEVSPLTKSQGRGLLLALIGRSSYSSEEEHAAYKFSKLLSGLPLAIAQIADQVLYGRHSITKFLELYAKHPRIIHQSRNFSLENKGLSDLWSTSFSRLAPESAKILGILSFFHPDNIVSKIVTFDLMAALPEDFQFMHDEFE